MEGERKKRKMDNEEVGEEEEEEDEENKIEKFFALIKSTRDLRDRLSGVNEPKDKEEKRPVEKEIKTTAVWNPKFQLEDFAGEDKPKSPGASTLPDPSKREEKEEEREVEEEDRGDGKASV
ncbi:hypothetical protein CIPAW_07G033600 [Carya illinoinensis]|uniref:Uncharacterized protein n=1 Tax=Carya illinoinensis TaxID=32201 RepID=A0A8T1PQM6_CARIL|nr:hypothetical protein CIPAW_07G033600 [Carya illinoinensis]